MNNNKLPVGFKETKEGLTFVFALANAIEQIPTTKDLNLISVIGILPGFLEPLMAFKPAYEDFDQIPVEFSLATQAEANELKIWVKEKFNVEADKVEELVEDAFSVILDLWLMINKYVKKANEGTSTTLPS